MNIKETLANTKTKLDMSTRRARVKLEKHSPEILLGIGIVSMVATVVTACRATMKMDEVLDEHNAAVGRMDEAYALAQLGETDTYGVPLQYDQDDYNRDKTIMTTKTAVKIMKLYAPSVALGALSVVSILASRNILNRRYLGAVAAYNAVTEAFEQYRQRVRDEMGDVYDRHYRFGTELEEITVEEVDENGKKKKRKEVVEVEGSGNVDLSDTARWFDRSNVNWQENPLYSMMFLRGVQSRLNDKLHACGIVFLNEVYEALGFDPTGTGAVSGWIDNDDHTVYIDFGIFEPEDENRRRFVNGQFDCIMLDFNVQGIIWDKIDKKVKERAA